MDEGDEEESVGRDVNDGQVILRADFVNADEDGATVKKTKNTCSKMTKRVCWRMN
jgi:hypothetical protein